MEPRDDDIEFDFFEDEPATTESQSSRGVRLPRRGGSGSGMRRPPGPARGTTPILRLLGAIVVLVVLLVLFGLLIQSCASTSKHDAYSSYMGDVGKIARSSQQDGVAVANALTAGSKAATIAGSLGGIANLERQNVRHAQELDPPGPLRPQNQQLIEALQLRISGVDGLARTLQQLSKTRTTGEVALLSAQADRLLASDVVWADLFQAPAAAIMKREGVTGVAPPDSTFIANRQLFSETSMNFLLQRLRGASTGGKPTGLHGTNLVSVKAQPGNQELSTSSENTVTATTDLQFVVTIENSGDSQEVNVKVTLTIQQDPAIVKTLTIPVINPKQQKSVTFKNFGPTVKFAQKEQVLVDVAPVPGEVKTDNNKATFPVIFSLG
jgi:CARDB